MQKRAKLIKCSFDLYKYLSIETLTGVISLNKSLDREQCSDFKYFIRATDLVEKRLSSVLTFKIHVNDLNDNGPKFEKNIMCFK